MKNGGNFVGQPLISDQPLVDTIEYCPRCNQVHPLGDCRIPAASSLAADRAPTPFPPKSAPGVDAPASARRPLAGGVDASSTPPIVLARAIDHRTGAACELLVSMPGRGISLTPLTDRQAFGLALELLGHVDFRTLAR